MSDVPTRLVRSALRDHRPESGSDCPTAETLAAWSDEALTAREQDAVALHASSCARCQAILAATARTAPPAPARVWWRRPIVAWAVPITAAAAVALWVYGPAPRLSSPPAASDATSRTASVGTPARLSVEPEPARDGGGRRPAATAAAPSSGAVGTGAAAATPGALARADQATSSPSRVGARREESKSATRSTDAAADGRAVERQAAEARDATARAEDTRAPASPIPTGAARLTPPADAHATAMREAQARAAKAQAVAAGTATMTDALPPAPSQSSAFKAETGAGAPPTGGSRPSSPAPAAATPANAAPPTLANAPAPPASPNAAAAPGSANAAAAPASATAAAPPTTADGTTTGAAPARRLRQSAAPLLDGGALALRESSLAATARAPIVAPDPQVRWRIGAAGTVEHTADGGATWQMQATGVTVPFTAGAAPSSTVCWLVGPRGTIVRSTNGSTWQRVAFSESIDLTAVRASDAEHATVTAADGRSFATSDGGNTWQSAR